MAVLFTRSVELVVGAERNDTAMVKQGDSIGGLYGPELVRNDERRATGHQSSQRVVHNSLELGIEGRGWFVEQKNGRIAQDRPCDRHELPLSAGEACTSFPDPCIEPVLQPVCEVMDVRRGCDSLHFFVRCVKSSVTDVFADGAVE